MSLVPLGVSIAIAAIEGLISPILIRPRSIGGFIADVTVQEIADDELEITQIPVESGAAITDHAYKRPARLVIRAGWSNSSQQAEGNPAFDIQTYQAFLEMQRSLDPFQVVTGKRVYNDMLARRVTMVTDESTENALMMTVECQEIIFVTTQNVTVPPASQMKNPDANAPTNPTGQQTLQNGSQFNSSAIPVPFGG
jgi:hypothetical protein